MKNILTSACQIKNGEDIDFCAHSVSINLKELPCTLISPFYVLEFVLHLLRSQLIAYLIWPELLSQLCAEVGHGGWQCVEERRAVWRRVGIVDCYFNNFLKQILTVELEN